MNQQVSFALFIFIYIYYIYTHTHLVVEAFHEDGCVFKGNTTSVRWPPAPGALKHTAASGSTCKDTERGLQLQMVGGHRKELDCDRGLL